MTKPKKSAEDLIKNLLFPLRANLKTLRNFQELTSELGMGEFISYNAESDKQLKTFINLQERALKVMFALTPPNIFYSLHFEDILKYPFLRKFFENAPAFQELYEYYKRHHELPRPDNPLETFINMVSNFAESLTPDFLLKLLTEGPYAIFKALWDAIGTTLNVMESDPIKLLHDLEKNIKVDPQQIIKSLLDPTTAVLANPFEGLWYAVITSTIALKEAYELPDLTPINTVITLQRIRPYLFYGDIKLMSEESGELKRDLKTLSPSQTLSIDLKQLKKLVRDGQEKIWIDHEGVKSNVLTLTYDLTYWSSWTTNRHDAFRTNSNLTASYIFILTDLPRLIRVKRTFSAYEYINLPSHTYENIFIDRDGLIWLKHESGFLKLNWEEQTAEEITIEEQYNHFAGFGLSEEKNEFMAFSTHEQVNDTTWKVKVFHTDKTGKKIRETYFYSHTAADNLFIDQFSNCYTFIQTLKKYYENGNAKYDAQGWIYKLSPELHIIDHIMYSYQHDVSPPTHNFVIPGREAILNNFSHAMVAPLYYQTSILDTGGLDGKMSIIKQDWGIYHITNFTMGTPEGFITAEAVPQGRWFYRLRKPPNYQKSWEIEANLENAKPPATNGDYCLLTTGRAGIILTTISGKIILNTTKPTNNLRPHFISTSSAVLIYEDFPDFKIERINMKGEIKDTITIPMLRTSPPAETIIKTIVA